MFAQVTQLLSNVLRNLCEGYKKLTKTKGKMSGPSLATGISFSEIILYHPLPLSLHLISLHSCLSIGAHLCLIIFECVIASLIFMAVLE